jgi:hypothetical protein
MVRFNIMDQPHLPPFTPLPPTTLCLCDHIECTCIPHRMRGSPGKVTEALMFAATTEAEREEETKAKDDKQAQKDDQEAKKSAKKDAAKVDQATVDLQIGSIVITSSKKEKARFDNFKSEVLRIKKTR